MDVNPVAEPGIRHSPEPSLTVLGVELPHLRPIKDCVQIVASAHHAAALTKDGKFWFWGDCFIVPLQVPTLDCMPCY